MAILMCCFLLLVLFLKINACVFLFVITCTIGDILNERQMWSF